MTGRAPRRRRSVGRGARAWPGRLRPALRRGICRAPPGPAAPAEPLYAIVAACFCSLKKHGELRGCIGTLTPAERSLGDEIARNAWAAAFRDPRFSPVGADELPALTYSVDVLSPSEPCERADLDPRRYGVIVVAGARRGVLLPDLPGIDTVERQLGIALQKAGIDPASPFATGASPCAASARAPAATPPVAEQRAAPLVALLRADGHWQDRDRHRPRGRDRRRDRVGRLHAGLPWPGDRHQSAEAAQLAAVPHHLVGLIDPRDEFSAGRYAELADDAIAAVRARGRRVIVAGGSGLYLRAALGGLTFGGPPSAALPRRARGARGPRPRGAARAPAAADPRPGRPIDLANPRRVVRALEAAAARRHGGAGPGAGRDELWSRRRDRHETRLFCLDVDRAGLRERVERARRRHGAARPARRGRRAPQPLSRTVAQAIGVREMLAVLAGKRASRPRSSA